MIELDGGQHYTEEGQAHDAERTELLVGYGLEVLRCTNREVDHNFEGICQAID